MNIIYILVQVKHYFGELITLIEHLRIGTTVSATRVKMEVKEMGDEKELKPSTEGSTVFPTENKYAHIRNKIVRNQKFNKIKREAKKVSFDVCW